MRFAYSLVGPLSVGAAAPAAPRSARPGFRTADAAAHPRALGREPVLRARAGARTRPRCFDPLQPLPVPDSLNDLVRARLAWLPQETREALALASALGTTPESGRRRDRRRRRARASLRPPRTPCEHRAKGLDSAPRPSAPRARASSMDLGEGRRQLDVELADLLADPRFARRDTSRSPEIPRTATLRPHSTTLRARLQDAVHRPSRQSSPSKRFG